MAATPKMAPTAKMATNMAATTKMATKMAATAKMAATLSHLGGHVGTWLPGTWPPAAIFEQTQYKPHSD